VFGAALISQFRLKASQIPVPRESASGVWGAGLLRWSHESGRASLLAR
jgi:hypothetical protein